MKKLLYVLLLSVFVISCSSDNDEPTTPIDKETVVITGKQIFRIDLKELVAKNSSAGKQKNLEPAFVLLSINDTNGSSIFTREKIALIKDGDSYVTGEIILESGTYTVVEFIVTDVNDVVISIAPKENSALAQFATKPLPFDFVVSTDETKETATENINAAGYTSVDFGYTGLSLTFPVNTDFFSLTVDETENTTTKILDLKSITGATYLVDWGDGTIDEYVSTISNSGIENTISHSYTENQMYTINISGAIEAIEFINFETGQEGNYESNLTSVDLEKLTLLKKIQLYNGKLTGIDISNNSALESIGLGYNQITSIDLTNNLNLQSVLVRYNELTEIDISQNPNVEFLWVNGNQISALDLTNNSKLTQVFARYNNLSNIDFSNNMNLQSFNVSDNAITDIDISSNLALTEINLGANNLQNIDVSKNTNLVRIDLYTNQLTTIDLSANVKLKDLYIEENNLATIDVSSNLDLERLYIKNNNFSSLDISLNTKMTHLNIGDNQFNETEIDQIINLMYDQIVPASIMDGYINYLNNPGTSDVSNATVSKINDLIVNYNWSFNNG